MSTKVNLGQYLKSAQVQLLRNRTFLTAVGEILVASAQQNFKVGGRYGSKDFEGGTNKWEPWSQEYAQERKKKGRSKVLLDTAQLRTSIDAKIQGNTVTVGSNKSYFPIHQFGGTIKTAPYEREVNFKRVKKGKGSVLRFAKNTDKGKNTFQKLVKYPGINITIPARPIIAVQQTDLEDMKEVAIRIASNQL